MKPLNITLPQASVRAVLAGTKKTITHKLNPRISRYFAAKTPTAAILMPGKHTVDIRRVEIAAGNVILHL